MTVLRSDFRVQRIVSLSFVFFGCTCSRVVTHNDGLPADLQARTAKLQVGESPDGQVAGLPLNQGLEEPPGLEIPRALHQSWKDDDVPSKHRPWVDSWKRLHPDWTYTLWTDEMNRQLVKQHYQWFLPIYDAFPREILRADSARYLYMHKYGGVYADLDFLALKPMDALLRNVSVALGKIADDDWEHNFPNAWVASVPGHPFWIFVMSEIIKAFKAEPSGQVEALTGPMMLYNAIQGYQKLAKAMSIKWRPLTFIPPGVLYPIDWRDGPPICNPRTGEYNFVGCLARYPDAYAITFWLHGWR